MAVLGRLWAGRFFGTNTGNLFIELSKEGEEVAGTARLMDAAFGLNIYRMTGSFDGVLRLHGEPVHTPLGSEAGSLDVTGTLTQEGYLRGEWHSSIGTAGTFEAYPHDLPPSGQGVLGASQTPEQIYTSTILLGAVRLYAKDLWSFAEFIRKDFVVGRIIVTYVFRGSEVTKYLEDFKGDAATLAELRRVKLTIQEPEAHGINRVVIVDLNALGQNEVRVQGINESWVVGKAEATARSLRAFESPLVTNYKKFGITLNNVIFLAMLVLIPAIDSLGQRAVFVVVVALLLTALFWLHSRFIPSAVVYLGHREPSFLQRMWPSVVSWLIAATASLVAALVFLWLTSGLNE